MPGPCGSTPDRRRGSVRRTTTHDSTRPGGILGPVHVVARGRDLHTGPDGATSVLDCAELQLDVDFPDRTVSSIAATPSHPGLQLLVGVRVSAGFRQAVDDSLPGERTSRSVRFQLLDDLPTALLVSGYAVQAARVEVPRKLPMLQHLDLCAGWVAGGTIVSAMESNGRPPLLTGPQAPSVDSGSDPLAWHDMTPLLPHGMRRRRRLDVWREGRLGMVDSFFRDSHMSAEGDETIVHEYSVEARIDLSTRRIVSCHADIGALPWPECPNAAASAERLAGMSIERLRRRVREGFVGPSTCTHLNDTLRSLEDVDGLLQPLL